MSLEDRIVEMAVVHSGDKLIINVSNKMPLDPYSSEPAEEQLHAFARRLNELFGDGVDVVGLGLRHPRKGAGHDPLTGPLADVLADVLGAVAR